MAQDTKIKEYVSLSQIRFGVQHPVNFYNSGRIHSALHIGRRMKSVSVLAIGQQWDIVNQDFYTNFPIKIV